LGDHLLALHLQHLLHHVEPGADAVDEGRHQVEPGLKGTDIAPETLDGVFLSLRHRAHAHGDGQNGDHDDREGEDSSAFHGSRSYLIKPPCPAAGATCSLPSPRSTSRIFSPCRTMPSVEMRI